MFPPFRGASSTAVHTDSDYGIDQLSAGFSTSQADPVQRHRSARGRAHGTDWFTTVVPMIRSRRHTAVRNYHTFVCEFVASVPTHPPDSVPGLGGKRMP